MQQDQEKKISQLFKFHYYQTIFSFLNKKEKLSSRLISRKVNANFKKLNNRLNLSGSDLKYSSSFLENSNIYNLKLNRFHIGNSELYILKKAFSNITNLELHELTFSGKEVLDELVNEILSPNAEKILKLEFQENDCKSRILLNIENNKKLIVFSNLVDITFRGIPKNQICYTLNNLVNTQSLTNIIIENISYQDVNNLIDTLKNYNKLISVKMKVSKTNKKIAIEENYSELEEKYNQIFEEFKEIKEVNFNEITLIKNFSTSKLNIVQLNLTKSYLNSENIKKIIKNLPNESHLKILNFSKNNISDLVFNDILDNFNKFSLLEELIFDENEKITSKGFSHFIGEILSVEIKKKTFINDDSLQSTEKLEEKTPIFSNLKKLSLNRTGVRLKEIYKTLIYYFFKFELKNWFNIEMMYNFVNEIDFQLVIEEFIKELELEIKIKKVNSNISLIRSVCSLKNFDKIKENIQRLYVEKGLSFK